MKNIFAFILIVAASGLLIYGSRRSSPTPAKRASAPSLHKSEAKGLIAEIPAVAPAKSVNPERERQIKKINEQVQTLTTQLENVDHELESAGFPKVFLDARLSENERARLLAKVQQSSRLQSRIARLKIQQIDLTSSESL